jgi:hypothetical protein
MNSATCCSYSLLGMQARGSDLGALLTLSIKSFFLYLTWIFACCSRGCGYQHKIAEHREHYLNIWWHEYMTTTWQEYIRIYKTPLKSWRLTTWDFLEKRLAMRSSPLDSHLSSIVLCASQDLCWIWPDCGGGEITAFWMMMVASRAPSCNLLHDCSERVCSLHGWSWSERMWAGARWAQRGRRNTLR